MVGREEGGGGSGLGGFVRLVVALLGRTVVVDGFGVGGLGAVELT